MVEDLPVQHPPPSNCNWGGCLFESLNFSSRLSVCYPSVFLLLVWICLTWLLSFIRHFCEDMAGLLGKSQSYLSDAHPHRHTRKKHLHTHTHTRKDTHLNTHTHINVQGHFQWQCAKNPKNKENLLQDHKNKKRKLGKIQTKLSKADQNNIPFGFRENKEKKKTQTSTLSLTFSIWKPLRKKSKTLFEKY